VSIQTNLADRRPTWHNPRILLILFTVFLCGAAAGALSVRMVGHRAAAPYWKEGGRVLTLDLMKKELNLTPDQAAQIETVLDDFMLYYQSLQGQMDDFRADGKNKIVRVLTPEQRVKFDKMMVNLSAKLR
jgi:Spy/CpxP family protein refolding chaperone